MDLGGMEVKKDTRVQGGTQVAPNMPILIELDQYFGSIWRDVNESAYWEERTTQRGLIL